MTDFPGAPEDTKLVTFHHDGTDFLSRTTRNFRERKPWKPVDKTKVLTLIPGLILKILVKPGQRVRRGEGVVILEAMKMANEVQSPWEGTVKAVLVEEGQVVVKNAVMLELV